MPYGIYLSADGAMLQSQRLEVLSNNLANVNTVGFKRDFAISQARYAEANERGFDYYGSKSLNDIGGGVMMLETKTDHSMGPVEHTGDPNHLVIDGDAYFAVKKGGETLLTRAGNFTWNAAGELVTDQGFPVLDADNLPIAIDLTGSPVQISDDGAINQGGRQQLIGMVRVNSPGDLVKMGSNLFRPLGRTSQLDPNDRRIRTGHLEKSTANPTLEMMDLIETTRVFEANVTMMRQHDQVLGNAVSRLLRMS